MLPPHGDRLSIVRARGRHRDRRVVGWIAERLAVGVPVALPPKHAKAGDAKPRERRAHEIGHRPEIFRDDFGAAFAEDAEQPLPERDLLGFGRGRKKWGAAVSRTPVRAVETDEVIDAVSVEQIGAAPRTLA